MTYSAIINSYENKSHFSGRTICAFRAENTWVALRLENQEIVTFSVEEAVVGRWFEVFPLCLWSLPLDYKFVWTELKNSIEIVSCSQMWREEWLEPSIDDSQRLGVGPGFTQFVAPLGRAPATIGNIVKVQAGIKLSGSDGRSLVICSSESMPFHIDFAINEEEIEQIMRSHTCN